MEAIYWSQCPPPTPLRFGDYRGHFCFLPLDVGLRMSDVGLIILHLRAVSNPQSEVRHPQSPRPPGHFCFASRRMAYGASLIVIPPPKLILNPAVMPIVHRCADPPPSICNRRSAIINRLCPPPTPLRFGDYRGHFCFLIAPYGESLTAHQSVAMPAWAFLFSHPTTLWRVS